mgnify:CR=1 FL=1
MNVTDKLYTEWAWRSKTGTPDINNPEDKAVLDKLVNELTGKDQPVTSDELISLIKSIGDDQEALKYIRKYIKNRPNQSSFFEYISQQNIDQSTLESGDAQQRVFNILTDNDDLEDYMIYVKKPIDFSSLGTSGNLVNALSGKVSPEAVKNLINIGGQEGGRGVGKAEIGLASLIGDVKMMKGEKGDLSWGGKYLEVKGTAARLGKRDHSFTGGAEILDTLQKANIENNTRPDAFMPALYQASQDNEEINYKKAVEEFKSLLKQVYDEEMVNKYITPEISSSSDSIRKALQKVYAGSYAKREGVDHFIFVDTSNNFGSFLSVSPEALLNYIDQNPKTFSSPINLKNGLAPQVFRSGIK